MAWTRRNVCNKDKDVAPGVKKSSCSRRESLKFLSEGFLCTQNFMPIRGCDMDLPGVAAQGNGGRKSARVPGPKRVPDRAHTSTGQEIAQDIQEKESRQP